MVGCKTSHDMNPHVDLANAKPATLIAPPEGTVIELKKSDPTEVFTFKWDKADYGYSAAPFYSVQIDIDGGKFEKPVEVAVVNADKLEITAQSFNDAVVNKLKLDADQTHKIVMRIVSYISEKVDSPDSQKSYSAVVGYTVKTYLDEIIYPSLGMPGNYQGWAPDNQLTRVWSIGFNDNYEGWLMMSDAAGVEFKFTPGTNWDNAKGGPAVIVNAKGEVIGTLAGGDNIKGVPNGYYKVNVDWKADKFLMSPVQDFGVVGDATPAGWGANTPLTYDNTLCVWSATVVMTDGEFKFRAGDDPDWKYNFGVDKGKFIAGGGNIAITAGTYKITLDLNQALPTYTAVKQ